MCAALRQVREIVDYYNIDATFYPCPKVLSSPHAPIPLRERPTNPRGMIDILNPISVAQDGPTWRPMAVAEGGKSQFPYMKDPNTGAAMYESDAIIAYIVRGGACAFSQQRVLPMSSSFGWWAFGCRAYLHVSRCASSVPSGQGVRR